MTERVDGAVCVIEAPARRVGAGIQLRSFGGDASARAWLRTKGIAA